MDLGYDGEVALVAASSKGLGRATAEAIASEGASVMLTSRDPKTLQRTAEEISASTGAAVLFEPADLTNAEDIKRVVSRTGEELGGLTSLVTNSGGPPGGGFEDFGDEAWRGAFELNLMSAVRLVRESLPLMRRRGFGRVVCFTSSSMKQPIEGLLLSNVFRTAVLGLAKDLSIELAPDNILVNALGPGRVETDRVVALDERRAQQSGISPEEARKRSEETIPLSRYGEPEEFGRVAAFLASPANTYTTGQALLVDGGLVRAL